MSLSEHVQITISQTSGGIARAGFGVPLILSVNAAWVERVRTYTTLAAVGDDFATDSPEYLAARAIFSQSPHPSKIKIGRAVGQPTKRYILTPVVQNSHTYRLTVGGEGVTETEVEVTSDASATAAEICALLVTALNAVVGKNFTATDTSPTVTITGDAAGDWFFADVETIQDLGITENHAEPSPTLATDLDAILLEDSDWFCLLTLYNSTAYINAAAAWVEAQELKIYLADDVDSTAATVAEGSGTDALDDFDELNYTRIAGMFHQYPSQFAAAAWAGKTLPLEPGSLTFAYKTLAGVTVPPLTGTHQSNLQARRASYYKSAGGRDFTWQGQVGDETRGFIDLTRDLDWLIDDMSKGVFGVLVEAAKVPYTDEGVSMITGEVRASLARAVERTILAADPAPVVTAPKVADISAADKADRILPDVTFTATLAGAIHVVQITGVVSV